MKWTVTGVCIYVNSFTNNTYYQLVLIWFWLH